eukprot:NODE_97_length_21155_cov_0.234850.p21 type:complete len:112 gc:universal NODE_97_length_21155_cov_0.234850:18234-17899(-)
MNQLVSISEQLQSRLGRKSKRVSKLERRLGKSRLRTKKYRSLLNKVTTNEHPREVLELKERLELLTNYQSLKSAIQSLQQKQSSQEEVIHTMKISAFDREQQIQAAVSLLK